jgi:hypothetical protein
MTDEELEAPAYLGRSFPLQADPIKEIRSGRPLDSMQVLDLLSADTRRDRSLGYLVILDVVLFLGTLAYAGEGWWLFSLVCGAGCALCTYGVARRARRRVREEMELTLREPSTATRSGSGSGSQPG